MKSAKSKAPDAQAAAPRECPFLALIPDVPSGKLTPEHCLTLAERLRLANAIKSDSPILKEAESQSFHQNCEIIRKAGIGLQLRNYCLLEAYETQQWRDKYQTIKDFAKDVADLSKSQMMKCIDSAKIALLMAEVGLGTVGPRGRQVEELAKVPHDHREAAWRAVLEAFALHGNSVSEAKHVLCNYCDEHGIKFGRREPNGTRKRGHGTTMQPDHRKATAETPLQQSEQSETKEDWTENLSTTEDHALIEILPLDTLQGFFEEFNAQSPGKPIGKILQELGSDHHNDQTSEQMEAALTLVCEKDPALEENLRKLALGLLAQAISQKLEYSIRESRIAKAERLERDFPSITNSLPTSILQFQRAPFDEFMPVGDNQKGVR